MRFPLAQTGQRRLDDSACVLFLAAGDERADEGRCLNVVRLFGGLFHGYAPNGSGRDLYASI